MKTQNSNNAETIIKNILIITPFFPPDNSPQSIQSFRLAKALVGYGHRVSVACCSPKPETQNNSHGIDHYSFDCSDIEIFRSLRSSRLIEKLYPARIYRFFRPYDPAIQMHKISAAIKAATKNASYDVVISIAEPLVSHAALLRYAKEFGESKRIVWFSDPPPVDKSMLKMKWRRQLIKSMLINVCSQSDKIVSVTEEIILSIRRFSDINEKSLVVPHAYDPDDWTDINQENLKSDNEKITVLHSGALYWLRKPQPLFEAVDVLIKRRPDVSLQLKFQGSLSAEIADYIAAQQNVDNVVLGAAPFSTSLKEMRDADILCIIDVDMKKNVHLPSKIADYVAARKPIIYVGTSDSPTCRILRDLHPAFAFGRSTEEISEGLEFLIAKTSKTRHSDFDEICKLFCLTTSYTKLQEFIIGNAYGK